MKVTKRYNQSRRDLYIDMECESCGYIATDRSAYDDRNFWDNVVPNIKCKECGKSSKDLDTAIEHMPTRYAAHQVV